MEENWFKRNFGLDFLRGIFPAVLLVTAMTMLPAPFYQRFMSDNTIETLELVSNIVALVLMGYGGYHLLRDRNIRVPDGRIGRDLMGHALNQKKGGIQLFP